MPDVRLPIHRDRRDTVRGLRNNVRTTTEEELDVVIRKNAEISDCGTYLWWLRRSWRDGNGEIICFITLNPSTADAQQDDTTIRRCIGFARAWGYSALSVRNLFPYRATHPTALLAAPDPAGGPRGDIELLAGCTAHTTVVAWGAFVPFQRDRQVLALIAQAFPDKHLMCLGVTNQGRPRHPLYVPKTQPLMIYQSPARLEDSPCP